MVVFKASLVLLALLFRKSWCAPQCLSTGCNEECPDLIIDQGGCSYYDGIFNDQLDEFPGCSFEGPLYLDGGSCSTCGNGFTDCGCDSFGGVYPGNELYVGRLGSWEDGSCSGCGNGFPNYGYEHFGGVYTEDDLFGERLGFFEDGSCTPCGDVGICDKHVFDHEFSTYRFADGPFEYKLGESYYPYKGEGNCDNCGFSDYGYGGGRLNYWLGEGGNPYGLEGSRNKIPFGRGFADYELDGGFPGCGFSSGYPENFFIEGYNTCGPEIPYDDIDYSVANYGGFGEYFPEELLIGGGCEPCGVENVCGGIDFGHEVADLGGFECYDGLDYSGIDWLDDGHDSCDC